MDKVSHHHLLRKLHASGVRGKLHQWMATYLAQRTQRVVVDGAMSQETRVLSGVPQGTVLGPLLFLTYINDITNDIKGQIRLFTDDALLYTTLSRLKLTVVPYKGISTHFTDCQNVKKWPLI